MALRKGVIFIFASERGGTQKGGGAPTLEEFVFLYILNNVKYSPMKLLYME